jgi:predicted amidohydrolase
LYSPGSQFCSVQIGELSCSLFICYDLRFGIPFHQLAPKTDLFIVVANWPASRREHWLTLLRARAIENQAYIVGVNRVGEGGGLVYSGDSAAYAPDGSEVVRLGDRAGVATVDINAQTVSEWRKTFPALRDRRLDLYKQLDWGE